MALLTPQDIQNHTFPTVRFKEGFDIDAVDDFLDEVVVTLWRVWDLRLSPVQLASLGKDVAPLNNKIAELTEENNKLYRNSRCTGKGSTSFSRRENVATGAVKDCRCCTRTGRNPDHSQNNQLKTQVDQLNEQIDQLTAQAAEGGDSAKALKRSARSSQA